MATKKFIIEVEEGDTRCKDCPLNMGYCYETQLFLDIRCVKFNLATMKITEMENESK